MTFDDVDEKPLTSAMLLLGPVRGHSMLGCDWGTRVATEDDQGLCARQARQVMVIHNGPERIDLKVCVDHFQRLEIETDPHRSEVPS